MNSGDIQVTKKVRKIESEETETESEETETESEETETESEETGTEIETEEIIDFNKILYGNIFTVPNSLQICDHNDIYCYDVENVRGLQVCFEGWITNDECDNWCCHYYKEFGRHHISSRFPVELFMGKRVGDTVELTIKNRKIIVTCAQLKYKYNTNNFEAMLYDLSQSFGGLCDASYFKPPFSERSQRYMLIVNHERYARSLDFEVKEPTSFRFSKGYVEQCKEDSHKTPYISLLERFIP